MEWDSDKEKFSLYRTTQTGSNTVTSLQGRDPSATFHSNGQTRFQQGELENCWLAAAIESLRQKYNQDDFKTVVPRNHGDLEFRFWHKGAHQRTVRLGSDAVPTRDENLIFMRNVGGSEYWGILLEKAYARWVGSYEGLAKGFWTDAIQSFTGGVVERLKIRDEDGNVNGKLFDIMLTSYTKGSYLCCIKKVPNSRTQYHAYCVVQSDEDSTSPSVLDPFTQKHHDLSYEEFTEQYHRLDMCHTNLDNLSELHGKNILQTPWEKQMFQLQLENGCVEFKINLTGTGDEQESCILVIELIQKIKPDEGEVLRHVHPRERLVCLELEVNDEAFAIEVPQESHSFFLNPGIHDIKVSTNAEEHGEIYMRVFSKTGFKVEQNERLIMLQHTAHNN